jgi:hypothetical protein
MTTEISSNDSVIDSRDVISRIEELEDELQAAYDQFLEDYTGPGEALLDFKDWLTETSNSGTHIDQDDAAELIKLRELAEQCEGYGDWAHGEALISRDHFVKYAQELADDTGAVSRDVKWPNSHIDWYAAAEELEQDYMSVTFNGEEYLMRA